MWRRDYSYSIMVVNTEQCISGGLRGDGRRVLAAFESESPPLPKSTIVDPGIVFAILPDRFPTSHDHRQRTLLSILNGVAIVGVALSIISSVRGSAMPVVFVFFAILFFVPIMLATAYIHARYTDARWASFSAIRRARDRIGLGVLRALRDAGMLIFLNPFGGARPRPERFPDLVRAHVDPRIRTVMHHRFESASRDVELMPNLIEAEHIAEDRTNPLGCTIPMFMLCGGLLFIVWMSTGTIALIAVFGLVGMAIGTRTMRDRVIRPLLGESRLPIAAPGLVVDRKGRRWRVDDSIMLVRPTGPGKFTVSLLGPSGVLDLSFRDTKYQAFRDLWVRWNHPHPRPELLE